MDLITATVRDGTVRADSNARVPWWSFTKTVLASAALALVALGRVPLDETLSGKPFTLRQLLQHRAGLPEYGSLPAYHEAVAGGERPWPVGEMLQRVRADTLLFEPGKSWAYSNVGYFLVRDLIEKAADAPLRQALERLVFAPLGIGDVAVAQEPDELDGTAWGNKRRYHPGWVYHGLAVGSAESAVLFLHRLLAGGLLPAALLDQMCVPHPVGGPVSGRPWTEAGYGLGLMIGQGKPPARYIGHTGGGPGSSSAVFQCVPDHDGSRGRRTAAAFAAFDDPRVVEERAMALAFGG
jgi:CubicO group peptidase (beta-lactamase class C family)